MAEKKRKAFWVKQFYLWHWVSSAICLASMLLFAVTGITLNHAGKMMIEPVVTEKTVVIPSELMSAIGLADDEKEDYKKALPKKLRLWMSDVLDVRIGGRAVEWSPQDIYIDLPKPGGDGWMSIDRELGEITYESTERGLIAYLNDLHKGRHTGFEWILFMDIFSGASIVFCITGLALLYVHARRRPMTWPVVIAGILLPFLVILIFVHN